MRRDQENSGRPRQGDVEAEAGAKRRYRAPEILSCEPLEAIAAVCPLGDPPPIPPLQTGKNVQGGGCVFPGS